MYFSGKAGRASFSQGEGILRGTKSTISDKLLWAKELSGILSGLPEKAEHETQTGLKPTPYLQSFTLVWPLLALAAEKAAFEAFLLSSYDYLPLCFFPYLKFLFGKKKSVVSLGNV